MSGRQQASYTRPVVAAIADGATTPNPGVVNTLAWSSTTLTWVRWNGSAWDIAAPHTYAYTFKWGVD